MINSRKIEDLNSKVQILCNKFVALCKEQNINILITSTYRDFESQNALYNQGRTTPGKKVTNARGGQSFHNFRCAFDFVPLINGKAQWNDLVVFKKCGAIAKSIGLEWAGDWKTFKEYAHCQFTGGLTLKDLQNKKV
jgi:peptidoglycan L-alanyl-D-glutamate endopeptidase CwlK